MMTDDQNDLIAGLNTEQRNTQSIGISKLPVQDMVMLLNVKRGAIADNFRIYWHSTEGMIAHNATPSRVACASIGETCASIGFACESIVFQDASGYYKLLALLRSAKNY